MISKINSFNILNMHEYYMLLSKYNFHFRKTDWFLIHRDLFPNYDVIKLVIFLWKLMLQCFISNLNTYLHEINKLAYDLITKHFHI